MKAATAMKASPAKKPAIRLAVVESDPLRFVGFRALFDSETDFELIAASLPDIGSLPNIDLVLLGNRNGQNLFDLMASLKASRPDLRIIVTGSGMDEETILKAIASGAKGYVDEAASPAEFVQAIRIVNQGSVWAPRRVLSMFIERVSSAPGRSLSRRPRDLYRPREGSAGNAGRGPLQQGNRLRPRDRGTHRQSPRGQVDAQSGSAEPDRAFGARHHALAGHGEVECSCWQHRLL